MATLSEIITAVKALIKSYSENTAELTAENFELSGDEYMGISKAGVMYKVGTSTLSSKLGVDAINTHVEAVLPHEFDLSGTTYAYGFSVNGNGDPVMTYEVKP